MVEPLRVVLLRMCEFGYNLTISFFNQVLGFQGFKLELGFELSWGLSFFLFLFLF